MRIHDFFYNLDFDVMSRSVQHEILISILTLIWISVNACCLHWLLLGGLTLVWKNNNKKTFWTNHYIWNQMTWTIIMQWYCYGKHYKNCDLTVWHVQASVRDATPEPYIPLCVTGGSAATSKKSKKKLEKVCWNICFIEHFHLCAWN